MFIYNIKALKQFLSDNKEISEKYNLNNNKQIQNNLLIHPRSPHICLQQCAFLEKKYFSFVALHSLTERAARQKTFLVMKSF